VELRCGGIPCAAGPPPISACRQLKVLTHTAPGGGGERAQCIVGLGGYALTEADNVQLAEAQRILQQATRVHQCTVQLKQALLARDYEAITTAKQAAHDLNIKVPPVE
jgi:hypothetical protein